MNKKYFFLLFLLSCQSLFSQLDHEFIGGIKLNDSTVITYLINFSEKDGNVTGYSITDLLGPDETKNIIKGRYDVQTKEFSFEEDDIEYTKSEFLPQDFCYIHFNGKLKISNKSSFIKGRFNGLFKNNQACIDGEIHLVGSEQLYLKLNKLDQKIAKSKRVDSITKTKVSLVKMLDSIKTNSLKEGENTSVFWNSNKLVLEIWDAGKEDGDIVSIYVDGKLVLDKFMISHETKRIEVELQNKLTEIRIEAINIGDIAPNTANIKLFDSNKEIDLFTDLSYRKSTTISVVRRGG
jgi:hypothetical protein